MAGVYWLASYPKSGNTWFRAFLQNLNTNGERPACINELNTGAIASSRYWLDSLLGFPTADLTPGEIENLRPHAYGWLAQGHKIGYPKIHDAYTYTHDGVPLVSDEGTLGALYIIRNPLDVAPSFASHIDRGIDAAIERMADPKWALSSQRRGLLPQVGQRLLTWSQHVLSWVDAPRLNCHVIRYEDMQLDPLNTFSEAAGFLQLPNDEARISKAVRFSDFNELNRQELEGGFKERATSAQQFFRQGRSGGWREHLTFEQAQRIINEHGAVMRRFGYLDDLPEEYGPMTARFFHD